MKMRSSCPLSISLAMLLMLLIVGTGYAADDLQAEIDALMQRIEALETEASESEIARADALGGLVRDVLMDAEQRIALRDHALLTGHDGRFFIASADGQFRLAIGGQFHVRYVANRQSRSPEDNHRSGMELRRMQLKFDGHVLDPRLTYKLQGGFNRNGGTFVLLDAEIGWAFSDSLSVRLGQFRPGFLREDSTSSTRQLAVERSLVNARFSQNRMQAIELRANVHDNWRLSGTLSDGLRSRNTAWDTSTVEFAVTGRAQWLVMGNWRQFRHFTSPPGESTGLMFGAALHWQRDEFGRFGASTSDEVDMIRWTVDGQLSLGGASLFAAFIGSHEDTRGGGGNAFRWGVIVQGGVYLTETWELFARYELGDADEPGSDRLSVITGGVNWYIDGRRLKWTTDVGFGLKPVDENWASSSAGWRADAPGRDGQVVVRSQLQLLF